MRVVWRLVVVHEALSGVVLILCGVGQKHGDVFGLG